MDKKLNDEIEEFYKEFGPSPLLEFVKFNNGSNYDALREALEKETEIPPEYIPQDMNDNLQQILDNF